MSNRILVASDGSKGAAGAVRLAHALTQRDHCEVRVLAVSVPLSSFQVAAPYPIPYTDPATERRYAEALRRSVLRQVEEVAELGPHWALEVRSGAPAPAIARTAVDTGATLILLGLGEHSPADRWLGNEAALKVVQLASVPVLAVPATAAALPRCAMVAVDFSDFSHHAARAAARLVGPAGELRLVHVTWAHAESFVEPGASEWVRTYVAGARARLEEMGRELEQRVPGLQVRPVVLEGDPAHELLRYAEQEAVELIASGSHGAGFFGRLLMGSVSTRLLRAAHCPVLVLPPRTVPAELEATRPLEVEILG